MNELSKSEYNTELVAILFGVIKNGILENFLSKSDSGGRGFDTCKATKMIWNSYNLKRRTHS